VKDLERGRNRERDGKRERQCTSFPFSREKCRAQELNILYF